MLIDIDDRENNVLMKELGEMEIMCFPKRLSCGDYVWEKGSVCIERKSIDDFCSSIMDGRMESQVKKMIEKYKHNYVLIAGCLNDRKTNINENCVLGMMVKLITEYDLKVIWLETELQLAFVLKRIMERHKRMVEGNVGNDVLEGDTK